MRIQHLFFAILISLILGCDKEPLIPKIVEELEFSCPAETSTYYLEGMMNESPFCYYDGVDGYEVEFSSSAAFRTEGSTIILSPDSINATNVSNAISWANLGFNPVTELNGNINGTLLPHLKHWVVIETPIFPLGLSDSEMAYQTIKNIGDLPLQSNIVPDSLGFNIVFRFNDLNDNASRVFEARGGDQEGSYLKITELDIKALTNNTFFYEVTFDFNCKLYYFGEPNKFFRKMEGELKIGFKVEL